MEESMRDILEMPFLPEQIKQREGPGGITLDYLEHPTVQRRLDEAFDGEWEFHIKQVIGHGEPEEVVVWGVLKADGKEKHGVGSHSVDNRRDGYGDAVKSAASDCLKRCAVLFGVGLHLYESDKPKAGGEAPARSGGAQASQAQVKFLKTLAMDARLTDDEKAGIFSKIKSGLTKSYASELITKVKEMVESRPKSGDDLPF